jgi:RND family efflux transporter MFP subunit
MHTQISRLILSASMLLMLSAAGQLQAGQFDATLQWSKRTELSVPISGVIQAVYVDVGQKVAKDEKLLQLDDLVMKAKLKQAHSTLISQEAHFKEAEREMKRAQELYDRTVLSDHDLQVAKDNKVKAAAERDKAQAMLVNAKQELKYSTLRAPFNALVLERNAQVGKVIAAQLKPETLFILADADHMLARLYANETQLAQIKIGQPAKVLLGNDRIDGVIKAIGFEPAKDNNYPVDVEFAVSDRVLRAGQHVKVELP